LRVFKEIALRIDNYLYYGSKIASELEAIPYPKYLEVAKKKS
jgi:hypothetical protein